MKHIVFGISIFIYLCFLTGLVLIFINSFQALWGWLTLRRRLGTASKQNRLSLISRLSSLVYIAVGKENRGIMFAMICLCLFFFVFIAASLYYGIFISLIIALLAAFAPILSLVSKILKQRSRGCEEGLNFINEFYRQYRIENKNIYTAMEKTYEKSEDYPICGKQLYNLLLRLRSAGSPSLIRHYCNDFALAIGTVWAKIVGICIASACGGSDISEALLDILRQLKRAKEEQEEKKRMNSEAARMTAFLVPVMYVSTLIMSVRYLGIPFSRLLRNQFASTAGMTLILLIVILFIGNSILIAFVNDSKLDL